MALVVSEEPHMPVEGGCKNSTWVLHELALRDLDEILAAMKGVVSMVYLAHVRPSTCCIPLTMILYADLWLPAWY
jgi:hypothetical protein